jgi:hypothetical protein
MSIFYTYQKNGYVMHRYGLLLDKKNPYGVRQLNSKKKVPWWWHDQGGGPSHNTPFPGTPVACPSGEWAEMGQNPFSPMYTVYWENGTDGGQEKMSAPFFGKKIFFILPTNGFFGMSHGLKIGVLINKYVSMHHVHGISSPQMALYMVACAIH